MLYLRGNIWWTKFMVSGKMHYRSTETFDKTLAKKIEQTIKSDIIRGRHSIPGRKIKAPFGEWWNKYIASDASSKSNIENKKYLSVHFLPEFKNKDVKDITQNDIAAYRLGRKYETMSAPKNAGKKESEISFRTVNIETGTLYNFFQYCIKNGLTDKNPVSGLKKLKEMERDIYLSPEEQERLAAAASAHVIPVIKFAALTGLRKSDVLGLKWDDVNMENMVYRVWINKTREWKTFPLSKAAANVLKNIEKECEFVFSYKGKQIKDIRRSFGTAVRRAGLSHKEGLTPHAMRHVFSTRLSEADVQPDIIMTATNHMSERMAARYKHLKPEALREKLDKAFGGGD